MSAPHQTGQGTVGTGSGAASPYGQPRQHVAENPVTGEQRAHTTETGAKVDQAWQDVKQKIPGTQEYRATHPTHVPGLSPETGGQAAGMGPAYATPTSTATGVTGTTATSPGVHHHAGVGAGGTGAGAGIGEKMREGWESVKEAVPGTTEHKAKTTGSSGMSTGYTKGTLSDY